MYTNCRVGVAFLCFEGKMPRRLVWGKGHGHSPMPCLILVMLLGERGTFLRMKEQLDFPETLLSGDSMYRLPSSLWPRMQFLRASEDTWRRKQRRAVPRLTGRTPRLLQVLTWQCVVVLLSLNVQKLPSTPWQSANHGVSTFIQGNTPGYADRNTSLTMVKMTENIKN